MNNMKKTEKLYEGAVFLTGVSDEMQANIVESLLRAYNIPVLKKRKGAGGYLNIVMGINLYGIDIYVPAEKIALSRELIQNSNLENESNETDKDIHKEIEDEKNLYHKKRLKRIWLIILIFYLPVLLWILYRLLNSIVKIFS